MYDYIVEVEDESGIVVQENLTPGELIEVDVTTSGELFDVFDLSVAQIEVLEAGPQGPPGETTGLPIAGILGVGEDPPPGTPPGSIFLIESA